MRGRFNFVFNSKIKLAEKSLEVLRLTFTLIPRMGAALIIKET